jgi:hypothetical protein
MHILIFILYFSFFSFIITRISFFRRTGLPALLLIILFAVKVSIGCVYGWIHTLRPDYLTTMDTWKFYMDGIKEMQVLKQNPWFFFSELAHDPYNDGYGRILATTNSYWNDLKYNVMIKLAGLFNLFSGASYYTNVIFYSFLGFWGPVALFRLLRQLFVSSSDFKLILICFLIPSAAFWTGGFHKEGLLFSSICLILYFTNRILQSGFNSGRVMLVVLSFAGIFILRNNLLLGLIPAWALWIISERYKAYTRHFFVAGAVLFITVFFTAKYIDTRLNLPDYVSQRQHEFMLLGGNTAILTDRLEPTFTGFIKHLPQAFTMGFLRPLPGEGGLFYVPFTLEISALMFFFLMLIVHRKKLNPTPPFLYFSLFFAVVTCLMIGYTITNTGATIRYRSIALPFLFAFPLLKISGFMLKGFTRRFYI